MRSEPILQIRKAFESEEYAKAERLWATYADELRRSLETGGADSEALAEAGVLLDWARLTVKCAHSHAEATLRAMRGAAAYGGPWLPPPRTRAVF